MLVVGLGNPGERYERTRHNAGRMFVDFWAKRLGVEWQERKGWEAEVAQKEDVLLVKPSVFMNESGKVVRRVIDELEVTDKKSRGFWFLIVVHDELDLPLGRWKLSFGKSSPLHKGVLSVERHLGTGEFWRLRIGIENRRAREVAGEKYVLQKFSSAELKVLKKSFAEMVEGF